MYTLLKRIGGGLGLFTGMSILSLVELLYWLYKLAIRTTFVGRSTGKGPTRKRLSHLAGIMIKNSPDIKSFFRAPGGSTTTAPPPKEQSSAE